MCHVRRNMPRNVRTREIGCVIVNVIELISSVTPRRYESQAYRVDIEGNDCKIIALHIVSVVPH